MASDIEEILGKRGFLHNAPNSSSLPSPEQLVGKVIIKSKRPESLLDGATVLNDDFDDEIRALVPPTFADYDSEDDVKENVIGFNSIGSVKAQSYTQKLTADQLFQIAKKEASEASGAAFAAQNNLIDCKKLAIHMQNHRDALLRDIGMSYNDLKKKREHDAANSINEYADEGTEVELLEDRIRVKEGASRAVQIAQLFSESVEESRLLDNAARAEARSEAELFEMARGDLTDKEILLAEAKEALQDVLKRKQDSLEASDRALAEARSNREYANNAKNRVAAVTALLDKSHDQAVSSETVAGTADAEAKISEQRARDAEARAEKARASAESERKSAEKETKLEDDLDAQLVTTHKKLIEAKNAVKAARERADDAVCRAEKVTDEIREAKSSPRHQHINETTSSNGLDDEKSIESFANQKSKERRLYIDQMENALTDKLSCEAKARRLENIIEDLKRKTKLQAKVAAVARRQADHADQLADQLEEHALEEREAANLRQAARAKAKLGVKSSDDVLTSTEAQLVEAERASAEANDLAVESRLRAEELAKEAEAMQDSSSFEENVRAAQKSRDLAYSVYESAKESKEEADERAAKAKQVHETNCLNMSNLERDAMAELLHRESAQQAEVLAMSACENAKAQHDQIKILEVKYSEARALVTEKEGALEIAKRYKEKKSRVQPISPTMAKLTLLHSSKLRNWEKSNMLPKWNVHSLSDNMIIERAEKGVDEWREWVHYNSDHFSRTFPSSTTSNYNPLLPWAMGCQFVSLNFIDNDDYIFLNDGRFRVNGNQGYVLKPEYLCGNEKDSPSADDVFNCNHPRKLNIRILSGYCLPKPISAEKKGQRRSVNPFVRVTLYDGSPATFLPPQSFTTQIVHGNGMNPVWNSDAFHCSCLNPSVGMLLFSVYDRCDVTNADLLISASAVPVSCIREGFRCVPMYDSNNTRSGAMKFASLFIYVKVF